MRRSAQRALQLLRIGIGDDEIHARQIQRDHVVDRIGPAAADTDDGDARREIGMRRLLDRQVQGHRFISSGRYR